MFSLFRRNEEKPEVPHWANFFSQDEYAAFLKAVDKYFKRKGITYTIHEGILTAGKNEMGFEKMGLLNVAQNCKMGQVDNYYTVVSRHYDTLIRSYKFEKEFEKIRGDYEKVKEYIGIRMYGEDYIASIGKDKTIGWDIIEDVYTMLVYDMPYSVSNIQPEHLASWNKTKEELYRLGKENIRKKCPFKIAKEEMNGYNIWFVQGEHYFVPNILLELEQHRELVGTKGSLVGIPHRQMALIYPIESMEVAKALQGLAFVTNGLYNEGPGSITNKLYWYSEGIFEKLNCEIKDQNIEFTPSEKFLGMLNSLSR